MTVTVLKNANFVLPDRSLKSVSLAVRDGRIDAINISRDAPLPSEEVDLAGSTVFPGFIDVHIHGAVGINVNTAGSDGLLKVGAFLAQNGVTAWMPTLVPDSDENYRRAIDAIDELRQIQVGKPVAQALGVHYEGVFASEQMCGALRPEFFRVGSRESGVGSRESGVGSLPKLDRGVHMTTLAPEIEGGIELVGDLVAAGWVVSIGHTKADAETLDRAFAAGARHITHFFNAMTGIHHRDLGVAGWGISQPDVTFDIIADGIHVHPEMLKMACLAKSPDKVSLISDSVAPTGLGDGEYQLWGETISLVNGRTRNERGSIAGSVITMHDAVKRMLSLGFSEIDVAKMASSNPACLLDVNVDRGSIEIGKRADLVAIDADGNIAFTMIGGEIVEK